MVHPTLCQSLSGGWTADPTGVKGLRWLDFYEQMQHAAANTYTYTNTHTNTCTHINKQYKTNTHTKMVIFVPFRSISPSNCAPPPCHVRSHNGLWHQPSKQPQCHLTLGADQPQRASLRFRVSAILLPDLPDKAVLQEHKLSLNNRSQRRHWLGFSNPFANCTTF